jgi:hypothetical protein
MILFSGNRMENPKDLLFPFVKNILDIIDLTTLEIIIKGFCQEIKQAIVFVSSDLSIVIPSTEFIHNYTCSECNNCCFR